MFVVSLLVFSSSHSLHFWHQPPSMPLNMVIVPTVRQTALCVCVCEHTVVAESRHPWGVFEQRRSREALFIMYAVSLNDRAPLLSWCPGHWLTPADSWLFMSWYHVAVFVHFYFAPFTYFSSWVLPCKVSALLGWLSPHCLVYLVMAWQRTCYFAHKLSTDQR